MLRRNYDLLYGKTRFRRWTQGAIDCYKRGCVCKGCLTGEIIGVNNCRMKEAVINLVRLHGKPPKDYFDILPGINVSEYNVIRAIFNGAKTYKEIAEYNEILEASVKQVLYGIYQILEVRGYSWKNQKNKLAETIDYLMALKPKDDESELMLTQMKGETQMYDEDLNLKVPNSMNSIIDAVKKGYTTPKEIAKEAAMTAISVNTKFFEFANYLKTHGLILGNDTKSNRQRVVDFIQSRLLDNDYIEKPLNADATPVTVSIEPKEAVENVTLPKAEYENLLSRIKELEHQPKMDFSILKAQLRVKITSLEEKLACLEDLEKELQLC